MAAEPTFTGLPPEPQGASASRLGETDQPSFRATHKDARGLVQAGTRADIAEKVSLAELCMANRSDFECGIDMSSEPYTSIPECTDICRKRRLLTAPHDALKYMNKDVDPADTMHDFILSAPIVMMYADGAYPYLHEYAKAIFQQHETLEERAQMVDSSYIREVIRRLASLVYDKSRTYGQKIENGVEEFLLDIEAMTSENGDGIKNRFGIFGKPPENLAIHNAANRLRNELHKQAPPFEVGAQPTPETPRRVRIGESLRTGARRKRGRDMQQRRLEMLRRDAAGSILREFLDLQSDYSDTINDTILNEFDPYTDALEELRNADAYEIPYIVQNALNAIQEYRDTHDPEPTPPPNEADAASAAMEGERLRRKDTMWGRVKRLWAGDAFPS